MPDFDMGKVEVRVMGKYVFSSLRINTDTHLKGESPELDSCFPEQCIVSLPAFTKCVLDAVTAYLSPGAEGYTVTDVNILKDEIVVYGKREGGYLRWAVTYKWETLR